MAVTVMDQNHIAGVIDQVVDAFILDSLNVTAGEEGLVHVGTALDGDLLAADRAGGRLSEVSALVIDRDFQITPEMVES